MLITPKEDHGNKRIGSPTIDNWKNVAAFVKFLKVFYDVTTKISGFLYVTSNSYFHELWGIRELLIQWSTNVNSVLSNMSSNMKVKYENIGAQWKELIS